ncbi:MAG: 50S ribosomal protein L24 [Deltaproteobacteria bacterium]|nr:50S ribosomal protein L24 [Deltaproteobacteria bacterium]
MGTTKKLKKNDLVEVIAGNEKGKRGKVLRILRERNLAVIEKVNLVKRHKKGDQTSQGGIVEMEAPLHISNIAKVCEKCDGPRRLGVKFLEDGTRARMCKSCGEVLDQ